MYTISNKQRDDIISLLKAFASEREGSDLRKVNMRRRALLLARKIEKRKQQKPTRGVVPL